MVEEDIIIHEGNQDIEPVISAVAKVFLSMACR